eukprot:TRINITY_DN93787_c0_g1_i1.p1 TRINITY_DN93787_c0_g1~~TRINITY_DN93787_c0_g1_i1.p1  ORF type:complete len:653 (-),score=71.22 TRINITY_DN93787_c0_g1_i1:88-2046(-)
MSTEDDLKRYLPFLDEITRVLIDNKPSDPRDCITRYLLRSATNKAIKQSSASSTSIRRLYQTALEDHLPPPRKPAPLAEDFQALLDAHGPPSGWPEGVPLRNLEDFQAKPPSGALVQTMKLWGEDAWPLWINRVYKTAMGNYLRTSQRTCVSLNYKVISLLAAKATETPLHDDGTDLYLHWRMPEGGESWAPSGLREYMLSSGQEVTTDLADAVKSDSFGFSGFMSWVAINVLPTSKGRNTWQLRFTEDGIERWVANKKGFVHLPGPVVHFHCAPETDTGLHAALPLQQREDGALTVWTFPPFTLFKLHSVEDSFTVEGVTVKQKRYTFYPTYRIPCVKTDVSEGGGKMVISTTYLSYGTRKDYVRGLSDIVDNPVLTMEQEWLRNHKWTAFYNGQISNHSGVSEWKYVQSCVEATGTGRDAGNVGMQLTDFMERANAYISASAPSHLKHIQLTLDEVTAVRLYTGPGYVVINQFLREVGKLSGPWRSKLSHDPNYTYAATVGLVHSALKKLAATTMGDQPPTSAVEWVTCYRGVRGKLPDSFFVPDSHGQVIAVDAGFMSTSLDKAVPKAFFDTQRENVLWEIHCRPEDEAGYHCGVDVELLSQFPAEKEYLFPPLTMLMVDVAAVKQCSTTTTTGAKLTYQHICAVPYFV